MEKRKASHPQKPHATSQPSRFSHTHPDSAQTQHTTSIATNSAPYTRVGVCMHLHSSELTVTADGTPSTERASHPPQLTAGTGVGRC